jgi:transcriptional regulator with XRE-family HTH domain
VDVGTEIKVARIIAGMKQQEVADLMGVSQVAVSRWERGEIKPPEGTLEKIKKAGEEYERRTEKACAAEGTYDG